MLCSGASKDYTSLGWFVELYTSVIEHTEKTDVIEKKLRYACERYSK